MSLRKAGWIVQEKLVESVAFCLAKLPFVQWRESALYLRDLAMKEKVGWETKKAIEGV